MSLEKALLKPDNPILRKVAEPIGFEEITSPGTIRIIEKMLSLAYGEQKDRKKPLLVGLAAPQIGISRRIILVDVAADGKGKVGDLRVFIDPEIVWKSGEESGWYEGCYSTNCLVEGASGCVCGIVSRPTSIKVRAYTPEGTITEKEYSGYTARIFQHEIDHLDGQEFVSRITDENKLHLVKDDEFPVYRDKEGWRDWHRKCSSEFWKKVKGI